MTAIDLAQGSNHPEIVKLLTEGPKSKVTLKVEVKPKKEKKEEANENNVLKEENEALRAKTRQLEERNIQLEKFLLALKKNPSGLAFFDFDEYEEVSPIGIGGTSSVNRVVKKEKTSFALKFLHEFNHQNMQRFMQEAQILAALHHPCIVNIIGFNIGDKTHPPSILLSLEPMSLESAIEKKMLTES